MHEKVLTAQGVVWPAKPWSTTHMLLGVPKTARYAHLIDCVWELQKKKSGGEPSQKLYVDISQNLERLPFSDHCRSLTRGSCIYSYSDDRCLTSSEHLTLLGFNYQRLAPALADMSPAVVKDLAGDAMSPASVTIAMMVVLLSCNLPELWRIQCTD